jgi:uncharacterized protein (DUF1501 family)
MGEAVRPAGCRENLLLSRRGLLGAGVSLYAWGLLPTLASAAGTRDPRLLVVILRGALDGLSAAPPMGDPRYADLRGAIAIPAVGTYAGLPLDGFFALHPSLKIFHRLYGAKQAAVVHAAASPYRERSHFDGQDVLESGLPGVGRADSGWLNRALAAMPGRDRVASRGGLGVGPATPLILRGDAPVMGWAPQNVASAGEDTAERLLALYGARDPALGTALKAGLQADRMARAGGAQAGGQADPMGMARAAEGAARLLAASDGPRVAALSFDGWDTHANQGGATGRLANLLAGLDSAFGALESGLAAVWKDTVMLVITEFGRTAHVNGTTGSDHGTGSVALLAGGAVKGGRVIADWPGLRTQDLHEGRDLRPTIDLRGVFKGLLAQHLGIAPGALAEKVFPGSVAARAVPDLVA